MDLLIVLPMIELNGELNVKFAFSFLVVLNFVSLSAVVVANSIAKKRNKKLIDVINGNSILYLCAGVGFFADVLSVLMFLMYFVYKLI